MKKKVLLLTLTPIYPLYSGGAQAQYYFIDGLKDSIDMLLCTIVYNDSDMEGIRLLGMQQPNLRIYYLDRRLKKKTSILARIKYFIGSFFRNKKNNIIVDDDFEDSYFKHIDHNFDSEYIDLINKIILNEKIDIVQLDFYDTIDLVYALPYNIKKIFIYHELRTKRLKLAYDKSNLSAYYKDYLINKTESFENSTLMKFDMVGVFNNDDALLLKPYCKKVIVTPFAIPDEEIFNNLTSLNYFRLLFVGGEGHTPNLLGLKWFLNEIYIPNHTIVKLPIYIIGQWSEAFKLKYKKYKNIIFTGKVESIKPYFENSIFINPIHTGSGLRTKVLHAMVNKVPVISTRFGAEGCFDDVEKDHIAFFDNSEEYLNALMNLDFTILSDKGYDYYMKKFNKRDLLKIRQEMYKDA